MPNKYVISSLVYSYDFSALYEGTTTLARRMTSPAIASSSLYGPPYVATIQSAHIAIHDSSSCGWDFKLHKHTPIMNRGVRYNMLTPNITQDVEDFAHIECAISFFHALVTSLGMMHKTIEVSSLKISGIRSSLD